MVLGKMVDDAYNRPELYHMSSCDNYLEDLEKEDFKKMKRSKVVNFNEYKNKKIGL
jgi:hypothetical protein